MLKRSAKRNSGKAPPKSKKKGFGYEMPPDRELVHIYFDQKGLAGQADSFYKFYDHAYWQSARGTPFRNWKVLAADWIFNYRQQLKLEQRLRANQSAF
jgi:hypothetical protein